MSTTSTALSTKLANLARTLSHKEGHAVEIDLDRSAYTSDRFDDIVYGKLDFDGNRWAFGVHETPGPVRVFIQPDDEVRARAALEMLIPNVGE